MNEIAAPALNNFAQSAQSTTVSQSETILAQLLAAIQDLKAEVSALMEERDQDRQEIAALRDKIAALESTQEQDVNRICIDIATDRKRISQLENKPGSEDSPLLDELYKEMKAIGRRQVDFATAARMVKRSKRRLWQLKAAIALDQRFVLIPSESHSQKMLIRLREFYQVI